MCETKSIEILHSRDSETEASHTLHFPVCVQQFHAAFFRQRGRQLAITQNVISQLQATRSFT